MGQTLSEPITKKKTTSCSNEQLAVASSCMHGWRISMEDAHVQLLSPTEDPKVSLFAIFDGHGGTALANHVSKHLHRKIILHPLYKEGKIVEAITKAHLELDYQMCYEHNLREDTSGTTSISVLIKDNVVYCANVGDSRALACEGGKLVELSHDHKPSDPVETDRIVKAGGWVEFDRVNGNLALSRALGDYVYKKNATKSAEEQMVTALPDVVTYRLNDKLEFIVLACDGIWDVMTNYEVMKFIRTRIAKRISLELICEELLNTCLAPDCRMGGLGCDNMTVLIIGFVNGRSYRTLARKCSAI